MLYETANDLLLSAVVRYLEIMTQGWSNFEDGIGCNPNFGFSLETSSVDHHDFVLIPSTEAWRPFESYLFLSIRKTPFRISPSYVFLAFR